MQTFLTFFSTDKVFQNLDRVRHSKQRSEAIHILETLLGIRKGYAHHPILPMWEGYEPWLATYAMWCCHSYNVKYGLGNIFKNGKKRSAPAYDYFAHITRLIDEHDLTRQLGPRTDVVEDGVYSKGKRKGEPRHKTVITPGIPRPGWRFDTDFLESHRSNLIRKVPGMYTDIFGDGTPQLAPYLWPENDPSDNGYILRVSKADRARLLTGERVLPDHLEMDETDGVIL